MHNPYNTVAIVTSVSVGFKTNSYLIPTERMLKLKK